MRTKYATSDGASEIAFLRTVLVWLITSILYQLNIFPDNAKMQSRMNRPRLRSLYAWCSLALMRRLMVGDAIDWATGQIVIIG